MSSPHAILRSKLLVVGPSTVGKTSIIKSFAQEGNQFQPSYSMTLSADVTSKSVTNEEHNITVEFFMYDISGSPIYEYEYPDIFPDANQILVVFDVTRANTLRECGSWLDKVTKYAGRSLPGVIVGNKNDLSEFADVSVDDCKHFAIEHGLDYFDVSAKSYAGILDPFNALAERFISIYESEVDQFINAD